MSEEIQREIMEYDVVIIGAGPAGLATAIKLRQLNSNLNVCILEKSSEVGAHILSGNIFETRALDELIPNWKEEGAPIKTKVLKEKFLFLNKSSSLSWPSWLLPSVQKTTKTILLVLLICVDGWQKKQNLLVWKSSQVLQLLNYCIEMTVQ